MNQVQGQAQQQSSGTNVLVQGRIVWGSVKSRVKKVYGTQMDYINPKTGKTVTEWVFGLAIPKPNANSNQHERDNINKIWNAVHNEAARLGVQPGAQNFAWKFEDGDGVDGQGTKKDGGKYPTHSRGHLIFTCKTTIPLKLMAWEGSTLVQITDDQIKCGDYVQVQLNIDSHPAPNPGMYINPSYVARFAYGEEIVNQPDPTTIFGNQAPAIPFGGSASPMGFAPPGMPAQAQQPAQQPMGFNPGQQAMPAPAPSYQPHTAVLPQHFQQPVQQQPMGNAPAAPGMYQNPAIGQTQPQPGGQMNYGQTAPIPAYPSDNGFVGYQQPVQQQQAMPPQQFAPPTGYPTRQ